MSIYYEAVDVQPSTEEELKAEISHLEETIQQQAVIIEELKKKLVENSRLDESEILTTSNKISLQETRILNYTINELREAMEKAKEETVIVRGLLESEKELSRSRVKELEKKCDECELLSEELKKVKEEMKSAKRAMSDEVWMEKEQILRKQYQIQVAEGQNKIAALNAKIRYMRDKEISLREENSQLQKQLETLRSNAETVSETVSKQQLYATKEFEVNAIRKQLEEVIQKEQSKDAENRDQKMTDCIEKLLEELKKVKEISIKDSHMAEVQSELGSLRATKTFLEKQVDETKQNEMRLNEELEKDKQVIEEQKANISALEEKVAECEKNAEITHRYLLEDISKPLDTLSVTLSTNDEFGSCPECAALRKEINDLRSQQELTKVDKEVETAMDLTEPVTEIEKNVEKEIVDRLKEQNDQKDTNIAELSKTLRVLDDQCERFLKLKKNAEAGREKLKEQLDCVRRELEETKRELERRTQVEIDIDLLRQEKDRLSKKVSYLTEELRETHTDYREELAVLARKMSGCKSGGGEDSKTDTAKLEQIKAEKRQIETTVRSLERQLEQLKEEASQRTKEIDEAIVARTRLTEENNKLRDGLSRAISKAEKYKEEVETARDELTSVREELKKICDAKSDAEVLVEQLNQTIAERERLVAYLQSQVRMKTGTKLKKSSSRSTLMSASDASENSAELASDLRKPGLGGSGDEHGGVALLHDNYSLGSDDASLSKNYFSQSDRQIPVPSAPTFVGTMKHDIPHRWKTYLVLKQAKCVVCLEGLPRVRHALKCIECGVLVHRGCSRNIANTCGLPSACADFYLDAQSNSSMPMSGWVKLWRSCDRMSNRWRNAWGTMDEQTIQFYDADCLPNANCSASPFLQLNLNHDQWRLHMQSVADVGVKGSLSKESYSLLIEIRMENDSLFLLAPTTQAKDRWVRALQSATNKKMFVQRQQSSCSADGNSMLLGLDNPLNLSINCAQVLNDWLLIGAQEGLFITPLNSPRVPFVVSGLTAVFHMEFLPELQMLVVISGSNRQLYALHTNDVYNSFNSDRPSVRPTPISDYTACHLMTVLTDSSGKVKWLCVADPNHLHILQFNARLGIFSPFKSIPTIEPAMCLLSVPDGFIFGTDQFYYVSINELIAKPLLVPGCPPDWPLAALLINSNELLLAYHNYGVFADTQGNRTRVENIDWNRAPLEFVYSAPYLYVVHYETLEILCVADYVGPNTRCLSNERDVYRCQNAHYLGRGRSKTEVLFALSAKDRTEVHSFTRPLGKKMLSTTLKRRQATTSCDSNVLSTSEGAGTTNPDKRSKK
uniref:Phorbol-ester/DAG-type domain-containing protein n=1 Tax=Syphacia muris TaxID=451379 RepID=A0A0N5AMG8_9BILA